MAMIKISDLNISKTYSLLADLQDDDSTKVLGGTGNGYNGGEGGKGFGYVRSYHRFHARSLAVAASADRNDRANVAVVRSKTDGSGIFALIMTDWE
jgi:hypothetical protein